MYPTAPKLIAAILFAGLAWLLSDLVKPLLPDQLPTGLLSPVNAAIGFLMGWRISGRNAGQGAAKAMAIGLTAVVATTFWALLFWAGREMLRRSVRMYYDDPAKALHDMVTLMLHYGGMLGDTTVLATAAAGGIFCGAVVEFVAQRT